MKRYKILKDLIKFNTIEDKQNTEIINYLESFLKKLGFKTEKKNKYLIMSVGQDARIGFLGHTDTVRYSKGWNSNPFELEKIDNKLYGLGTCDMKGAIAAMLDAISQISFYKLKYGIKLYFTYDEEIGFKGINNILNTKEKFPEIMIFGEPTNNEILSGSKGLIEYEFNFKGIKAHSCNPEKGKSANLNAIKFISELNNFYNKRIKLFKNNKYEVPYTTMNIGLINGGSEINSVSDNCKVNIDFRIASKEHMKNIKRKVDELSIKYQCSTNIMECIEPFENEINLVKENKFADFITEASFVQGCKRIILGLGPITSHELNEYITEESYNKLVEQYKFIIEKVCNMQ